MRFVVAMLLCFASSPAISQAAPVFGTPGFGGTGCPAGREEPTLVTTVNSIRLTFEQFEASTGRPSRQALDRQSCNLSIPVDVPEGRSLAVTQVSYSGIAELEAGATGELNIEVFFAGERGEVHSQRFRGESEGAFSRTAQIDEPLWSVCGAQTLLRVNANMLVRATGNRQATIGLRSQWYSPAVGLRLEWRDC